jgi:hypothetical protein
MSHAYAIWQMNGSRPLLLPFCGKLRCRSAGECVHLCRRREHGNDRMVMLRVDF